MFRPLKNALRAAALWIVAAAAATPADGQISYRYFKERTTLRHDPAAWCVVVDDATTDAALREDFASRGLAVASVARWFGPRRFVVMAEPARDLAAFEAVAELIAASNLVAHVSPIFRDRRDLPTVVTEHALLGVDRSLGALDAERVVRDLGAAEAVPFGRSNGLHRLRFDEKNGLRILRTTERAALRADVSYCEPDFLAEVRSSYVPNDPAFPTQWALASLRAADAWDRTTGSATVKIVVLDDGVALGTHPDLPAAGGVGANFAGGAGTPGAPVTAFDGHGTLVAGCLAARIDNGVGGVGAAPHCGVISARIASATSATTVVVQESWVVSGLAHGEAQGARISNLSYALPSGWSALAQKYADTRGDGMIHFAAAGNDGPSFPVAFPANLPDVLGVAALAQAGGIAPFSNGGAALDFCAPGENVHTTDRVGADGVDPGDFAVVSGTSFASPFAAAAAALVLSVHPLLTPEQVEQILSATAVDLGAPGADPVFGRGAIDLAAAASLASLLLGPTSLGTLPFPPLPAGATPNNARLGEAFAALGDVNGDGVDDFAVGVGQFAFAPNDGAAGAVRVHSGATKAVLWEAFGTPGPAAGAFDHFGSSVAGVGDVNGDGVSDLAVGAPNADATASGGGNDGGRVFLYSGANGALLWSVPAITDEEDLGRSVAGAGDLNGDSVPDVVVGVPYYSTGTSAAKDRGGVLALSGSNGARLWFAPGPIGFGTSPTGTVIGPHMGEAVASLGDDANGDGVPDVLAGAPEERAATGVVAVGAVRLLSGATGAVLWRAQGEITDGRFGLTLAAVRGDLDADGIDDLAVGAPATSVPAESGYVAVVSGALGTVLRKSVGEEVPGQWYGRSLSCPGDLDGDGAPELLIGSPFAQPIGSAGKPPGCVYLVSALDGSTRAQIFGTQAASEFGWGSGPLGDVDGDGFTDFAVGAPKADLAANNSGAIVLFSGRLTPILAAPAATLAAALYGWSVDAAGDVDGDGYADVVVGAPGVPPSGAAYVVSPKDGSLLHALTGTGAGSEFGASVAGVGDVNGDGRGDFAVGAPKESVVGVAKGAVRVYSGATGSLLLPVLVGTSANGEFGAATAGAGDVNGDGTPDVVVGAPADDGGGSDAGLVRVFSGAGGGVLRTWSGLAGDRFGFSVDGAGDVDFDGADDVIVGAPQTGVGAGYAVVYSGASGAVWRTYFGAQLGDAFGYAVAGVGDVDGDGAPDLGVGAPDTDVFGASSGSALFYRGGPGGTAAPSARLDGSSAGSRTGVDIDGVGDVDGDGTIDVVIGEQDSERTSHIYSPGKNSEIEAIHGPSGNGGASLDPKSLTSFGGSVAGAGDVNGDGVPDVVVGAFADASASVAGGRAYVFSVASGLLGPFAAGNIQLAPGAPYAAALFVNGSDGGKQRSVGVGLSKPFTVGVALAGHSGLSFAVFGYLGIPGADAAVDFGPAIGGSCFMPCLFAPGAPGLFTFTDNLLPDPCPPLVASTPTPWQVAFPALGLPFAFDVTLQGVLYRPTEARPFQITNAVVTRFIP